MNPFESSNISLEQTLRQCFSLSGVEATEKASLATSVLIITSLRAAQCCSRCALRYLGCLNQELYACSLEELDHALDLLCPPSQPVVVCTACLGTLQYADDDALTIQPIITRLESTPYETSNFALTLTLPVSLLHRGRLLGLYIQDQLEHHHKNTTHLWTPAMVRDPKDPIRMLLIQRLAQSSGLLGDLESPFHINLCLGHPPTETEHLFLTKMKDPILQLRQVRKRGVTTTIGDSRQNITEALKSLSLEEARSLTSLQPSPQTEKAPVISVTLWHASALTGGRYNKFSRECSQTPWVIKGKRLTDLSVSECITHVFQKYHQCQDVKFVTAGREDANVRMLGTGRPFYCELMSPRRPLLSAEEYQLMEHEINAASGDVVQVRQIQNIYAADTKLIKEGEESKRKSYRALVWFSQPLTQDIVDRCNKKGRQPFVAYQKTPIRVFQRRAAATREKTIYRMTVEKVDNHYALVTMDTQAGTYIKEFVHSDLGRTQPNLASIAGVDATDLLDLDVVDVDLVWPPTHLDYASSHIYNHH